MLSKFTYLLLAILLLGCSNSSDQDLCVFKALESSGDNRPQLENVLKHYANDSLKLQAAKFLIGNMPGHYSYSDTDKINTFYDRVDSILKIGPNSHKAILDSINSIVHDMRLDTITARRDEQIITADFLISHIDNAFDTWNKPMCRSLSFDDFSEMILPYKTVEAQPFDNWRASFTNIGDSILRHLVWGDESSNSYVSAADTLNKYLQKSYGHEIVTDMRLDWPILRLSTALKFGFGTCNDFCRLGIWILRSAGIPAANDFIPIWGNKDNAHTWVCVYNRRGKPVVFTPMTDDVLTLQMVNDVLPKAYRHTFAHNDELISLQETEKYIPAIFQNRFIKDVTAEYVSVSDVTIKTKASNGRYIYLACSTAGDWTPVAFAKTKAGKALFKNVGRGCVYLPVSFDSDGKLTPLDSPFLLNADGKIISFNTNKSHRVSADLKRKFMVREYVRQGAANLEGSVIEVADNANFNSPTQVARISDGEATGHTIDLSTSTTQYRYWRIRQFTPGKKCAIANIEFLTGDTTVQPAIIGSDKNVAKSFDKNLLTAHVCSQDGNGWIGVDYGKPVNVNSITLTPLGDGNTIEPGDTYELFYWDYEWKSLGTSTAKTISLHYDNIPSNALLLLVDKTKGQEHRIFMLSESSTQIFL